MSKNLDHNRSIYQKLTEEILKQAPNQLEIKTMMEEIGLSYQKDPALQMTSILEALDSVPTQKRNKNKEQSL